MLVCQEDMQKCGLGIRWYDFVRNTEVIATTNLPSVQDIITKIATHGARSAEFWALAAIVQQRLCTNTLLLSLRFNGYFPGEPGLASVY